MAKTQRKSRYPIYPLAEDPLVLETRGKFFDHYINLMNEDERNTAAQMRIAPVERRSWRDMEWGSGEYNNFIIEIRRKVPFMGIDYLGYRFENVAGMGGSGNSIYVGVRSLRKLQFGYLAKMIQRKQLDISALDQAQTGYLERAFKSEGEMRRLHEHLLNLPEGEKKIAAKVLVETPDVHSICPQTLAGASVLEPTLEDLSPEVIKKEKLLERFLREGDILRHLDHPNIVKVYECREFRRTIAEDEVVKMWFYTMEFLPRSSADTVMFPKDEAIELATTVGEAIAVMHERGIIHRDIKPLNIMFNKDDVPKVTDPGIAKRTSVADYERTCLSVTEQGQPIGTPNYMSPEQIRDAKNIDFRGDIYSLGVTLYRWLTGKLPYKETSSVMDTLNTILRGDQIPLRQFLQKRNRSLERAVEKAIQKDPNKRYQTMAEFVDALKAL
ncbi:MAG: serine/threonine protein kinase [Nanoarchaeota archaeon]|nr:serine/threonine protein kinase [Nanoarchaeota archaeon]